MSIFLSFPVWGRGLVTAPICSGKLHRRCKGGCVALCGWSMSLGGWSTSTPRCFHHEKIAALEANVARMFFSVVWVWASEKIRSGWASVSYGANFIVQICWTDGENESKFVLKWNPLDNGAPWCTHACRNMHFVSVIRAHFYFCPSVVAFVDIM